MVLHKGTGGSPSTDAWVAAFMRHTFKAVPASKLKVLCGHVCLWPRVWLFEAMPWTQPTSVYNLT
jgi:hypothetical protein